MLKGDHISNCVEKNNRAFKYCIERADKQMYKNAFESQEHFNRKFAQMSEEEKAKMHDLSKKLK
jgi:hypothetical protein